MVTKLRVIMVVTSGVASPMLIRFWFSQHDNEWQWKKLPLIENPSFYSTSVITGANLCSFMKSYGCKGPQGSSNQSHAQKQDIPSQRDPCPGFSGKLLMKKISQLPKADLTKVLLF